MLSHTHASPSHTSPPQDDLLAELEEMEQEELEEGLLEVGEPTHVISDDPLDLPEVRK